MEIIMDDTLQRFWSSVGITCFIRDFEWFLELNAAIVMWLRLIFCIRPMGIL